MSAAVEQKRLEVLAARAGGHAVGAPATRDEERAMAIELLELRSSTVRLDRELRPLRERMAKGRAKYPEGCTALSLIDEAGEVAHAINKRLAVDAVREELLDVAAVAMRLYVGEIDTESVLEGSFSCAERSSSTTAPPIAHRQRRPNGARLDEDGTAKGKTEILAVFDASDQRVRTMHMGMAESYVVVGAEGMPAEAQPAAPSDDDRDVREHASKPRMVHIEFHEAVVQRARDEERKACEQLFTPSATYRGSTVIGRIRSRTEKGDSR